MLEAEQGKQGERGPPIVHYAMSGLHQEDGE